MKQRLCQDGGLLGFVFKVLFLNYLNFYGVCGVMAEAAGGWARCGGFDVFCQTVCTKAGAETYFFCQVSKFVRFYCEMLCE